jgi:membrane protein implicated in regulation of membrane protease activity
MAVLLPRGNRERSDNVELSYWLLLPQVWVILGIVLVAAELLDTSTIFFLPLGVGSLGNAALIALYQRDSVGGLISFDAWDDTLIPLAVMAVAVSLALQVYSRGRRRRQSSDINEY